MDSYINCFFTYNENGLRTSKYDQSADTGIDTAIGAGSYYLAAGTMSIATAGLLAAGVAVPGFVIIGGVVILCVGYEHVIRSTTGYWE